MSREHRICIHQIHLSRSFNTRRYTRRHTQHTHIHTHTALANLHTNHVHFWPRCNNLPKIYSKQKKYFIKNAKKTFYWMNLRHLRIGRCHQCAFPLSHTLSLSLSLKMIHISRSAAVNPKQMTNQQCYGDLWRIKYSHWRDSKMDREGGRERCGGDRNANSSSFVCPISHNLS